jgi:hypothetical protein
VNGFVVRLAVLSVLWAFCEMLLPEGKSRRMVQFIVSLMMMLSLIGFTADLLGREAPHAGNMPVLAETSPGVEGRRIFLQARANQLRSYAIGLGERAGFRTDATVYMQENGAVERMELTLWKRENGPPIMTGTALAETLARTLDILPEKVVLRTEGLEN